MFESMNPALPDFAYQARIKLIDLLNRNGPLTAEEAMSRVLAAERVPQALAGTLIEVVTRGDERFRQLDDGRWAFVEAATGKALRNVDFVVLDVETTGLQPPADRITEIGAVRVRDGEIADEFSTLVNPERVIPLNVVRLTGITNEMVDGQPTAADILPRFREWIGDAIIVAHNAPFDRFFIDSHWHEIFGHTTDNTWLCSVRVARKLYPQFRSKSLGPLCQALGIPTDTLHRAAGDARATALVLLRELDDLAARGVTNLDALFALVSPTVLSPKRRRNFRGADPSDEGVA